MRVFRHITFSKIYYTIIVLLVILLAGVFGYMAIEGYSWVEAFYMTIITVSTVGFGELRPLSEEGRLFTAFLIIFSFGTFAYAVSAITTYVVGGEFKRYFKDIRVRKQIQQLEEHVIICGYGRNGQRAAMELIQHKKDFVVIENNKEIINKVNPSDQVLIIEGDAMEDEVLRRAGIDKAGALITTIPEDAANVYVVLTARGLNSRLFIVSRASTDSADSKLRMAGANNVIMPDKIGGAYMASLVLQPDVIEFINTIIAQNANPTNIEEIYCDQLPATIADQTIGALADRITSGATIIGFKTPEGDYIINPAKETSIVPGAKLFVLGTKAQIQEFK